MEYVYSQLKMFHFHDKLDTLLSNNVTPPIHVRLKPINACNHRCFYCCYRNEDLFLSEWMREKDMIPQDKMREIIEDMAACDVKAVTFTGGGEPLIYPHIDEAIEKLSNKGIHVAVLTNGSNLKGRTAQILAQVSDWIRISIDAADRDTLSKSRNIPGQEFDNIISNIESFSRMKRRDCELGINFIVTESNAGGIFKFIKLMKELGADHVKISECVVSTKGSENDAYHGRHFSSVLEQISMAVENLSSESFHVINKFHEFEDKFEKKYSLCPFIQFINVIAADQNVYTCQDKAYTQSGFLGSIKHGSLLSFWESEKYRDGILSINPSKDCNHHCVQHGKNLMLLDYIETEKRHLEFV